MAGGKEWDMLEIATLRREFPRRKTGEVAEMLGRSYTAVSTMANKMGLKKVRNMWAIEWTPQMISLLKASYPTMFTPDLAKLLKVSQRTLTRKARELGLQKVEGFLDMKRQAIRARTGAQGANSGSFTKGCGVGVKTQFKPGHKLSPEAEEKRREAIKRSHARRKMLKMCGLKDLK